MSGDLDMAFLAEVRDHLKGWDPKTRKIVAEPDAEGAEPIVCVRVVGSADFDLVQSSPSPSPGRALWA